MSSSAKQNPVFRRILVCVALASLPLSFAGCGGGGSSSPATKAPTATTRANVHKLQSHTLQSLAQGGVNNATLSAIRGSLNTVAPVSAGAGEASAPRVALPMTGAFINRIAANSKNGRAHAIAFQHSRAFRLTREAGTSSSGATAGSPGSTAPDPGNGGTPPPVTFYYDEYLGLWVDINDTTTQSTFTLYEDEQKTKPAGSITTTLPTADTFPQVYSSAYTYTAGSQKGAHGSYVSTYNADGSGKSVYEDTFANGDTDSGDSAFLADGTFTWKSDSSYSGAKSHFTGTFHSDGSGNSHSETGDGYTSDYTYHADGSGQARISGPDAGLPATIVWNAEGLTVITYADGSTETFQRWAYGDGGGGDVVPVATTATTISNN